MGIHLQIKNREEDTLFPLGSIVPISYLYSYETPITSQAKSAYCQSFLQIEGHFNVDITEEYPLFALWANTSWTPTNSMTEYYRDVLIEEIRAGAVVRSIRFSKAYVIEYYEKADINEDNTLAFKMLLAQKIDCIDEIEINGMSRITKEDTLQNLASQAEPMKISSLKTEPFLITKSNCGKESLNNAKSEATASVHRQIKE